MSKKMEKIQSKDGTEIAYFRSGSGPALIIVNGALSDHSSVAPLLPFLENHFTVYAYDRRGRGGSGDNKPYSVQKEIDDLRAVVSLAESAPVYVFGHSSGAVLALDSILSGLNADKLVLYEPPLVGGSHLPPGFAEILSSSIAKGDRDSALIMFFREAFGYSNELINGMKASPYWNGMLELAHTLPYDVLIAGNRTIPSNISAMKIPTLVIAGAESPTWMRESMEALSKAIPNGKLLVLAGQGHSAAPELLSEELIKYL